MNFIRTIAKFFQDGGQFMIPIAVVAVIGVAIAIERYLYLTWARSRNQSLWKQIEPLLGAGNFRGRGQVASQVRCRPSARSSTTAWRASRAPSAAMTSRRRWRRA